MTIAKKIVAIAVDPTVSAVSLYSCTICLRSGATITIPRGVQELEQRNDTGRVTKARYHYADGSRIHYSWSEKVGPKFNATIR